jgi:hypothetical protein
MSGKGGGMVHGMVKKRCFPYFNRHEQVHALMQGMQEIKMITNQKWFSPKPTGQRGVCQFQNCACNVFDEMAA